MHDGPLDLSSLTILKVFFPWTGLMVNKQTSISQRLFTDLKHARVQLHGGPLALINLRISVAFSRCQ